MEYEIESDEPVSLAVVLAVSEVGDTDPCSLPPLANYLDPDALDALFDVGPEGSPRNSGHISFIYDEYRITIDNGEYLTVRPLNRGMDVQDIDRSHLQ